MLKSRELLKVNYIKIQMQVLCDFVEPDQSSHGKLALSSDALASTPFKFNFKQAHKVMTCSKTGTPLPKGNPVSDPPTAQMLKTSESSFDNTPSGLDRQNFHPRFETLKLRKKLNTQGNNRRPKQLLTQQPVMNPQATVRGFLPIKTTRIDSSALPGFSIQQNSTRKLFFSQTTSKFNHSQEREKNQQWELRPTTLSQSIELRHSARYKIKEKHSRKLAFFKQQLRCLPAVKRIQQSGSWLIDTQRVKEEEANKISQSSTMLINRRLEPKCSNILLNSQSSKYLPVQQGELPMSKVLKPTIKNSWKTLSQSHDALSLNRSQLAPKFNQSLYKNREASPSSKDFMPTARIVGGKAKGHLYKGKIPKYTADCYEPTVTYEKYILPLDEFKLQEKHIDFDNYTLSNDILKDDDSILGVKQALPIPESLQESVMKIEQGRRNLSQKSRKQIVDIKKGTAKEGATPDSENNQLPGALRPRLESDNSLSVPRRPQQQTQRLTKLTDRLQKRGRNLKKLSVKKQKTPNMYCHNASKRLTQSSFDNTDINVIL